MDQVGQEVLVGPASHKPQSHRWYDTLLYFFFFFLNAAREIPQEISVNLATVG